MPAVDLDKQYSRVNERVQSLETYKQVQDGTAQIVSQQQSSLEQNQVQTASPLNNLKEQQKRYQRQISSQLDKLLDLNQLLPDNRVSGKTSSSTVSLVKNAFTESLNKIKSRLPELIVEEMIKQLGCSQEQSYESAITGGGLFIPVESIDLFGMLKESPTSTIGKISYEKKNVVVDSYPFSFNKELYNRIQNEGVSYDSVYGQNYLGLSNQNLFDIEYVTQDGLGNQGNFFKVNLKPRANTAVISEFFTDYFKTIEIVDTKNIFLQVFQYILGSVSIEVSMGVGQLEDQKRFERIMTRILGLCFDDRAEIDVSGNAKVAPLDGVDDSFFELTDIDIREIEREISNIKLGVVEFLECTTVKLPIDNSALLNVLNGLLEINDNDTAALSAQLESATDSVLKNRNWPQIDSLKLAIDKSIIQKLPIALYSAVLSPKVLLPFMTMFKAMESIANNTILSAVDQVYDLKTFMQTFSKFNIEVMSKIGAEFVAILRNIIVRDIRKLLQAITRDLKNSQATKQYAIISQLIEASILVTQLVDDYRRCKSVIDDILNIIEFALRGTRINIPPFLLSLSALRTGFNATRAMLETIQQMQKYGIPTGPMPDGSPNTYMIAIKAQIEGMESERDKNSRVAGLTPQQIVLPIGITIPVPFSAIPL